MARKLRHSSLESRTSRLKLVVNRKPYPGPKLARGVHLYYRRNKTNGTWVLKASDGHGAYWTKAIAEADDHDESNGKTILTFFEAQDVAKKLASGEDGNIGNAPITLDGALTAYSRDLIARMRHDPDQTLGLDRRQRWRMELDPRLASIITAMATGICVGLVGYFAYLLFSFLATA